MRNILRKSTIEIYKNHFVRSCPFSVPNQAKCLVR